MLAGRQETARALIKGTVAGLGTIRDERERVAMLPDGLLGHNHLAQRNRLGDQSQVSAAELLEELGGSARLLNIWGQHRDRHPSQINVRRSLSWG